LIQVVGLQKRLVLVFGFPTPFLTGPDVALHDRLKKWCLGVSIPIRSQLTSQYSHCVIIYVVDNMNEVHRQVLRENLTYLQDNLSPEDVLDKLFAAGIISGDQLLRLRKETNTKSCVRELAVYILPKAGTTAFAEFIKALKADQHTTYISEHLLVQKLKVQQRLDEGNSVICTLWYNRIVYSSSLDLITA